MLNESISRTAQLLKRPEVSLSIDIGGFLTEVMSFFQLLQIKYSTDNS